MAASPFLARQRFSPNHQRGAIRLQAAGARVAIDTAIAQALQEAAGAESISPR